MSCLEDKYLKFQSPFKWDAANMQAGPEMDCHADFGN